MLKFKLKFLFIRGIVKEEYLVIIMDNFLHFCIKTYIVGTH